MKDDRLSAGAWDRIMETERRLLEQEADSLTAEKPGAIAREPECAARRKVAALLKPTINPDRGPNFWRAYHDPDEETER